MRPMTTPLVLLLLTSCISDGSGDRALGTIYRPSELIAQGQELDGKTVFVKGYLFSGGHPWDFHIAESRRVNQPAGTCVNLDNVDIISMNRRLFDRRLLVLKGVYRRQSLHALPGCVDEENGFIIDQKFFTERYCKQYCSRD